MLAIRMKTKKLKTLVRIHILSDLWSSRDLRGRGGGGEGVKKSPNLRDVICRGSELLKPKKSDHVDFYKLEETLLKIKQIFFLR